MRVLVLTFSAFFFNIIHASLKSEELNAIVLTHLTLIIVSKRVSNNLTVYFLAKSKSSLVHQYLIHAINDPEQEELFRKSASYLNIIGVLKRKVKIICNRKVACENLNALHSKTLIGRLQEVYFKCLDCSTERNKGLK